MPEMADEAARRLSLRGDFPEADFGRRDRGRAVLPRPLPVPVAG